VVVWVATTQGRRRIPEVLRGWMVSVVGAVGHVVAANANSGNKTKWGRNEELQLAYRT